MASFFSFLGLARAASFASVLALGVASCSDKKKKEEPVPPGPTECNIPLNLQAYDYTLKVKPSSQPPRGLSPEDVPQFVSIGWDDNGFLEPVDWLMDMMAERELQTSFFLSTTYISDMPTRSTPLLLRRSLRGALLAGHEFGTHAHAHLDGAKFSSAQWREELETARYWLNQPFESDDPDEDLGLGSSDQQTYGFRAPFLNYSDAVFDELKRMEIWYDCSIEEGWQLDQSAGEFSWPYTLDEGSPAHEYARERDFAAKQFELTEHPGVLELPAYALVVPPDSSAEKYGFDVGLLSRIREHIPERESGSDRVTGLDYNLWSLARLEKNEFVAILKYNLDERLAGNRAPFLFGTHSDFYREDWPDAGTATMAERREAMEEFVDYARGIPEVIIGTHKDLVDYMQWPRHIDCFD